MKTFATTLPVMAAMVLVGPFHAADLDAMQAQEQQQQQMERHHDDHATDTIEGTLAERENGAFVIMTRTGERMSFELDETLEARAEMELAQLDEGAPVVVHYLAIATKIDAKDDAREMDLQERQRQERMERERMERERDEEYRTDEDAKVEGTVAERENGAFTIVTEAGERKTFQVKDEARDMDPRERDRARDHEQEVNLDELEEGQQVVVHYRAIATEIEAQGERPR